MKSSFGTRSVKGQLPGRDAVVEVDMLYQTAGQTRSPGSVTGGGASPGGLTRSIGGATMGGTRSLGASATAAKPLGATTGGSAVQKAAVQPLADSEVANRFPETPTRETKLRLTFEELDIGNEKAIKPDGFKRVMKALNMGFTADTVEDLYNRMDVNGTKSVTFPCFLDWAEQYPVCIDAFYYRSRELVERTRREAKIENTREHLENMQRAERLAQQQYDVAHADLEAQQRAYNMACDEHQNRIQAEKDRSADLFNISRDVERVKTDRNSKDLDFQSAKEAERAAFKPVKEVQYQIGQVEAVVAEFEDALMGSQEKERQLEKMLEEAKRHTAKLTSQLQDANDEVGELKNHEKEVVAAHEEVQRECNAINMALQAAEAELNKILEAKQAAEKAQKAAAAAIKKALGHMEEEERKMAPLRERDSQHKTLHQAAIKKVDDADLDLRNQEGDLNNYIAFRNKTELDEYPLMEHEVRLREQRYNLDDRDEVHHDETTRFINATGHKDTRGKTTSRI